MVKSVSHVELVELSANVALVELRSEGQESCRERGLVKCGSIDCFTIYEHNLFLV